MRLRLRGRDVEARPELIGDLDEVQRLLEAIVAANPTAGRFVGIRRGPDGRLDRRGLEDAVRHGFRVVRWHLDREEPTSARGDACGVAVCGRGVAAAEMARALGRV